MSQFILTSSSSPSSAAPVNWIQFRNGAFIKRLPSSLFGCCCPKSPLPVRNVLREQHQILNPESGNFKYHDKSKHSNNSPFNSTKVRINHQTHISLTKKQIWSIAQDICKKEEDWDAIRRTLAALECVYQFEYQLEGERVLAAFQQANNAECVIEGEIEEDNPTVILDGSRISVEALYEIFERSAENENVNNMKMPQNSLSEDQYFVNKSYHKKLDALNAAAIEADECFINGLLSLISKAHFDTINVRDVALSRSLNSEYLSQIYVKGNVNKIDETLATDLSNNELPAEIRPLLIFKRGYGIQKEVRRLLLPMLDYLQLLVVKSAMDAFKNFFFNAWISIGKLFNKIRYKIMLFFQNIRKRGKLGNNLAEEELNQHKKNIFNKELLKVDRKTWKRMKLAGKDVLVAMNEWGVSPRTMSMGGGLLVTLADMGYLPRVDYTPLETFDHVWPVKEAKELNPVFIERVALPDTLGYIFNSGGLKNLFKQIELKEPTFEHMIIVYRQKLKKNKWNALKKKIYGPQPPKIDKRNKIEIRLYNDIPIPIWKAIVPQKLLQFRPLDGLRLDLITLVGLASLLAQARFSSIVFDIVTIMTLTVYGIRVIMGYKKMFDRYANFLNNMLRQRTVAGQEGALAYLANSAALQQFKQTALAYTLLSTSDMELTLEQIAAQLDIKLQKWDSQIHFDSHEATIELQRLGLLIKNYQKNKETMMFSVVSPKVAVETMKSHWEDLLEGSFDESAIEEIDI